MASHWILSIALTSNLCLACVLEEPVDIGEKTLQVREGEVTAEFPEVVALAHEGAPFCTGVLISTTVVLTAAHCLLPPAPPLQEVIIGPSMDEAVDRRSVRSTSAHPGYDATTLDHDLGLVELGSPLAMTPVLSAGPSGDFLAGREVTVVGFGATMPFGARDVKRMGISRVETVEGGALRLVPLPGLPCSGDSGGPVLWADADGYMLLGVVSHGDIACLGHAYAQYAGPDDPFLAPHLGVAEPPLIERYRGCSAGNGATYSGLLILSSILAAISARARRRRL